jgi:bleomycin hydrolase
MKRLFILLLAMCIGFVYAQEPAKAVFKEYEPGFYQKEILPDAIDKSESSARKYFAASLSAEDYPTDPDEYTTYWHTPPHSQGSTGTCWCFATISFLESEVYRGSEQEIRLSEMYIVYWEYVERARAWVENRGDIYFAQGSEAASVLRILNKYGIVPEAEYPGLPDDKKFHNHGLMVKEMSDYLEEVKVSNAWNTVMVISTIRNILDRYLGVPPQGVEYKEKQYTPINFMKKVLKIDPDDYFSFMSTMSQTYDQKGELVEPDNWWHCDDYYNVKIEDFLMVIDDALDSAYTVCICGDVSEPGYDRWTEVGIVPDFDIPSSYINEASREMRLTNGTTTDDHCIHIVGMQDLDGERWYIIKDSGSGGFDGPNKGYRFMHEDYIRLKMMNIMVYKYAGKRVLDEIIK